jgi:hypothetical protein
VTAAALLLIAAAPQDAAAFFPLTQGASWVYTDTVGVMAETHKETVGNTIEIGGAPATPIVTWIDGQVQGSTYYRVEGDTVWVVAFVQNAPLEQPYPVLKVGPRRTTWEHTGTTEFSGQTAPMKLKGSSRPVGKRKVLGTEREVVEVVVEAEIDPGAGTPMKSHQTALYARGVGLYEIKEKLSFGQEKAERKRVLQSFSPGGGL